MTYAPHSANSTKRKQTRHQFVSRALAGTTWADILSKCNRADCAARLAMSPHIERAERLAKDRAENLGVEISSENAIYLLAEALSGTYHWALEDPLNYCKLLLQLAFNTHWAPTPSWHLSQAQMANPIKSPEVIEALSKPLTIDAARLILAHDETLCGALRAASPDDATSLSFWIGELTVCEQERRGDFAGNSVFAHVHVDGPNRKVQTALELNRPFNPNTPRAELDAGSVLRAAIMRRDGIILGKVTKVKGAWPDLEIEGLPYKIEHTKADTRPWHVLAKSSKAGAPRYDSSEDITRLFTEWLGGLKRKGAKKYAGRDRVSTILLLDSGSVYIPLDIVKEFRHTWQDSLEASGYAEVWYACMFSGIAELLYRRP